QIRRCRLDLVKVAASGRGGNGDHVSRRRLAQSGVADYPLRAVHPLDAIGARASFVNTGPSEGGRPFWKTERVSESALVSPRPLIQREGIGVALAGVDFDQPLVISMV